MNQEKLQTWGIVLNIQANAGRAKKKWDAFLNTQAAKDLLPKSTRLLYWDGSMSQLQSWIESQAKSGVRCFVAAGGDGTVNACASALMQLQSSAGYHSIESRYQLGAIGIGSSNDFHKSVSGRTTVKAKQFSIPVRLEFDRAFAHDVGQVFLDSNASAYFVVNASVGFLANGGKHYNQSGQIQDKLKRYWLNGAVTYSGLKTWLTFRCLPLEMSVDAGPTQKRVLANVSVIKNRHFVGKMRYDSEPKANDGRLGLHIIERVNRFGILRVLSRLNHGQFKGLGPTQSLSVQEVKLKAQKNFVLETDGELHFTREAFFRVLPNSLQICP